MFLSVNSSCIFDPINPREKFLLENTADTSLHIPYKYFPPSKNCLGNIFCELNFSQDVQQPFDYIFRSNIFYGIEFARKTFANHSFMNFVERFFVKFCLVYGEKRCKISRREGKR